MELKPVNKSNMSALRGLYKSAFPRIERTPLFIMKKCESSGTAEILEISDKNQFLGLAITLINQNNVLLNYFAIDDKCRGNGIGGKALKMINERYSGKKLVLEIESPDPKAKNNCERIRRKSFYLKNDMTDIKSNIYVFGIPMELLTNGCEISFKEYHDIYSNSLGNRFAKRIANRNTK